MRERTRSDAPRTEPASSRGEHSRRRVIASHVSIKQRQVTAHVRFRGGATTTLTLPRPRTAQEMRVTSEEVRREMNALLDEYTDAHVAAILNERGLRTGAGDAFDTDSVRWVRCSAGLESLKKRLLAAGMLTSQQMAARLGVNRTTLGSWRRQGRLKARICNDHGEWLYWPLSDQRPADVQAPDQPAPGGRDSSAARGAV